LSDEQAAELAQSFLIFALYFLKSEIRQFSKNKVAAANTHSYHRLSIGFARI
jgi:hypothetical protein